MKVYSVACFLALAVSCQAMSLSFSGFSPISLPRGAASEECVTAMEGCAYRYITHGKCKTTVGSFQLDWVRNDVDNNCTVNAADYIPDVEHFYDTNKDGQLCREEWIRRRMEYFDYTRDLTTFEWGVVAGGQDCVTVSDLNFIPDLDLRSEFSNNGVQRLVDFCNQGNNLLDNRDCLGLVTVCREIRPDLAACSNVRGSLTTLKEKIDLVKSTIDANRDGLIFATEIGEDLRINYDVNGDGCVSQSEYVQRMTSFHQLSADLARFMYDFLDAGSDDCLNLPDVQLVIPSTGIPTEFYGDVIITDTVMICKEPANDNTTNADCAQVVDTCRLYFPENDNCKQFLSDCGLKEYSKCISDLSYPWGRCGKRQEDSIEVGLEGHRMQNQITAGCQAYTIEDIESCLSFENVKRKISALFGY